MFLLWLVQSRCANRRCKFASHSNKEFAWSDWCCSCCKERQATGKGNHHGHRNWLQSMLSVSSQSLFHPYPSIHPSIHAPCLPIHPGNSWRQELCCSACCVVRCQHRELVCDSMIHPVCFAGSSPVLRRNHADRWPYACGGRGA